MTDTKEKTFMEIVEMTRDFSSHFAELMDNDKDIVIALTSKAWDHYSTYPPDTLATTSIVGSCMQVILNCARQMADANYKEADSTFDSADEAFEVFVASFSLMMTEMAMNPKENVGVQQ